MAIFKQENCYNKIISVRKSYISKSVKKKKLLAAEKFGNILAFDEESKRKLLSHISADIFIKNNIAYNFRVEISFISKWKIFWFRKNFIQILWIFSCNKCILVGLWVKVFVSREWVQEEITVTISFRVNLIGHFNLHFLIDTKQVKQQKYREKRYPINIL